jgi:hypothetical protein
MIERPDADALLAGPLGDWLEGQSSLRERTRERMKNWGYIAIGAAMLLAFVIVVKGGPVVLALQLSFGLGAAGFALTEWIKRPVVTRIKGEINAAIGASLGLSYAVAVPDRRDFETAREFGMLPGFDKAALEDAWWGEVGGRPFRLHEAKLTERRGSGKSRRTVTTFQGVIMSVGFARNFTGTTLIERDGRHKSLLSLFGREKMEIKAGGVTLSRMDTVDPTFDQLFDVWTNDQVEAHYLIHPQYVERLVALERAFGAKNLAALFRGGELLVLFESGNQFESGSLDSGDDRRLLDQAIGQFAALADVAVRLNERAR